MRRALAVVVLLLLACTREEPYHSHWLDDAPPTGDDHDAGRYPVCLCLAGGADVNIVVEVPEEPAAPNGADGPVSAPECCVLLPNTKRVGWTKRKPQRVCACDPPGCHNGKWIETGQFCPSHAMSHRCCGA